MPVIRATVARSAIVVLLAATTAAEAAPRCRPIAAAVIAQMWMKYRAQPGAAPLSRDANYECIDIAPAHQVACRTRPANPAHPSIVIRTAVDDGGKLSIRTQADTAAACPAFLEMMRQFQVLTDATIRSLTQR